MSQVLVLQGECSEGKRRGNQIQEVCGLALLPELRLSRFSINISGKNGTKMWVRPHEDMHGPRKDLSLCSNSWPLSWWCHPTISSSIIPLLLPPSISPSIRVFFQWVGSLHQVAKLTGASASASVLPMNIQGCFPLGLTGLISLQSLGVSRVFSSNTVRKHQLFSLFYDPNLTSIHDYWKNHSFDYTDLCQQNDVSAF